jgi:hypothetical protein
VLDTTLAEEDKNWKPKMRQQIMIPPLAPSGQYKIAIQVTDDLNKTAVASQEIKFEVRGRDVEPSGELAVRNFHFYRAEDDREPLATAAYKPGDTLWARFDIVGYRFAQEKAAEEKSYSFYPKPYVPGSMNLDLQKTIRPGNYAIAVTVRDHAGNQTCEAKGAFTVE